MKKKKNEEALLQAECVLWYNDFVFSYNPKLIPNYDPKVMTKRLFCVNNNSNNAFSGSRNVAMGVQAGVSDMVFIGNGKVFFIEFKTETGVQSADQKIFEKAASIGFSQYAIVRKKWDFELIVRLNFPTIM